jgi:hypothetical protein
MHRFTLKFSPLYAAMLAAVAPTVAFAADVTAAAT